MYIPGGLLIPDLSTDRSSTLSSPKVKELLKIALDNQTKIIPLFLLAAGMSFLFGLLSALLLEFETRKAQGKCNTARKITIVRRLMLCFLWTSTALAVGAAFSTTQLAEIVRSTTASSVGVITHSLVIEGGTSLQVLQWLAASFNFLFSTGLSSIFMEVGDHQNSASKNDYPPDDVPSF